HRIEREIDAIEVPWRLAAHRPQRRDRQQILRIGPEGYGVRDRERIGEKESAALGRYRVGERELAALRSRNQDARELPVPRAAPRQRGEGNTAPAATLVMIEDGTAKALVHFEVCLGAVTGIASLHLEGHLIALPQSAGAIEIHRIGVADHGWAGAIQQKR